MYDNDDFEEYGQPFPQDVQVDLANLPPGCALYNGTVVTQNVTDTAEYWGRPHAYQQNNVTFQCSPIDIMVGADVDEVGANESDGTTSVDVGATVGIFLGCFLGFAMLCVLFHFWVRF